MFSGASGCAGAVTACRRTRPRSSGRLLLDAVVRRAREAGCARLVLDSRADLVEARTLYERAGFVEVEPYNDNPHAQVWYALDLR
jgi:ribosomal protein S18 acetylase RimI-like enzyme